MAKSQTHYSGLSLLWRTVLALMIGVIVTQILMYLWIQRSVSSHFEHMDSEVLTHAAFDLRQRLPFSADRLPNSPSHPHSTNISLPLSYDLNIVLVNQAGDVISSIPDDFYPVLRQSLIEQKQDNTAPQSPTKGPILSAPTPASTKSGRSTSWTEPRARAYSGSSSQTHRRGPRLDMIEIAAR